MSTCSGAIFLASTGDLTLWAVPLLGVVAVGVWALVTRKRHHRRIERWLRELYSVAGRPDPGAVRDAREAEQVWQRLIDHLEESRQQQVEARSMEVRGNLLLNENRSLQAVFQALPIGILALRSANRIIYANEVASHLLRLEGEEDLVLDSSGGAPCVVGAVRTIVCGDLARGIRTERIEVPGEDGEVEVFRIRLLANTAGEADPRNDRIQIVTFENITSEETTQRMKTEFVYGVSHELKTPLTSIQASLEMLVDEENLEPEDRKRLLDLSYSESIRLGRMVRELLDLARVEAGVTEVHRERVVIADLMNELKVVHEPLAARKSITLNWEVSEFAPTVVGDRDLLLQAFVNLIGNAIKYTRQSGRVDVKANVEGEELVIAVSDNGIGISQEDLPKVFDKFYRSGTAKKSSIPGTGLGLPMARFIVETHGGRIEVESVEGEGTTFTTYLPREEAGSENLDTTGLQSLAALTS